MHEIIGCGMDLGILYSRYAMWQLLENILVQTLKTPK